MSNSAKLAQRPRNRAITKILKAFAIQKNWLERGQTSLGTGKDKEVQTEQLRMRGLRA